MNAARLLPAVSFVLSLLLGGGPAAAGDVPAFGGPGGAPFRSECPPRSYVVGLSGGMGAWLDSIEPLCAPLQAAEQRIGPGAPNGVRSGGGGGQPFSVACPVGYALGSWDFDMVVNSDHEWTFVNGIVLECRLVGAPGHTYRARIGDYGATLTMDVAVIAQMGADRPRASHACPPGELVTGIHGRAGLYVDALGLACGAPPSAADAAACAAYRDAALQAVAESQSLQCGNEGARWSADANAHMEWCMDLGAQRPAATQAETGARAEALASCRTAQLGIRERPVGDAVVAPPDVGVQQRPRNDSLILRQPMPKP